MEEPIVVRPGEGERVGTNVFKAVSFRNVGTKPARLLNLHTPGGFVEYRRELVALHEQGLEPDDAFFERHDVFDA